MLAEVLVQLGVLKPEALASAAKRQQRTGEDLDEAVLAMQLVSERDMLRATARQFGHQYLTTEKVADLKIPDEALDRLPVRIAEALSVMPFRFNPDGTLWVLSPISLAAGDLEQLRKVAEARTVSQILARKVAIRAAQRRHYYRDAQAFTALEEKELLARMAPPVPDSVPDFDITETPVESDGDRGAPANRRDETTRPRLMSALPEEVLALQRENERLRTAHSLASTVASVHHLDVLATELLTALLDLFAADAAAFALTGENGAPLLLESRARSEAAPAVAISAGIVKSVVSGERPLLVLDAQADDRYAKEESIAARKVRSVVAAPIRSRARVYGALYLESQSASTFDGNDLEMAVLIGTVAGSAVENALSRQRLEDEVVTSHTLRRFLPADAVDRVGSEERPSLLPARSEGTVVVARLPDFEAFTRGEDPDEVMRRIDELIDALTLPVFANGGTLQGELRGGISAIFGLPRDEADHEERAIACAVELAKRAERGQGTQGQLLCIGMSSGPVTIGAVGPLSRMQFLAVGATAERAFQLASLAAPGDILACQGIAQRVDRFLTWEERPERIEERGEERPVFSLRWR